MMDHIDALLFLSHICRAVDISNYCVAGSQRKEGEYAAYGRWVGKKQEGVFVLFDEPSHAWNNFGRLAAIGAGINGRLEIFPDKKRPNDHGFFSASAIEGFIVSVAQPPWEHCLLLSLVLLYKVKFDKSSRMYLTHGGFSFPSRESYYEANSGYNQGYEDSHNGYLRKYFLQGSVYREHEYNPQRVQDYAQHLDFECQEPDSFLNFVSEPFGVTPVYRTENKITVGEVWVRDNTYGQILGVTAREKWIPLD